jgi:hypothetical protein
MAHSTGAARMRKLMIASALVAANALTGTASANIIYTLNNVQMNSLTTGLGVTAGTLTGEFTVNGTTVVSADITASMATVSVFTFPGFEYTYGIPGANSTLTNGLGQAEPNFEMFSGSNELELAWVAGNASPTLISAFDPNHSFEHEATGGNRFVTSGDAPDAPLAMPAPLIGRGLPVTLAVGGLLFGAKLLERRRKRGLQFG